jgi:hypothetical protein
VEERVGHFKVTDLLISVVYGDAWCGEVTLQPAGGDNPPPGGGLCAVSHDPVDCGRVAGVTMCGVGCTDCTACTNCTQCTHCTQCSSCTQCSACTGSCTQCTGQCTHQCTGPCTYQCTGYCTNSCTNPSNCGATPYNCGYSAACGNTSPFRIDLDRVDPVALAQLRGQLREALANVEAAGRRQDERLLPATIEDVDMLERKLKAALEALRERRAELERRRGE